MMKIEEPALVGSWTHVGEEDSEDLLVFRPSDSDIPPARGRESIELLSKGELRRLMPGPDDRRVSRSGSWYLRGNELMLCTDSLIERYQIESLDQQRLIVRKRPLQDSTMPTGE